MAPRMSAVAALRARTAARHDEVDAAYAAFRLDRADDYRDFLLAHARALPSAEAVLATAPALPRWRPRTPLLTRDLAELNAAMPPPLAFAAASAAAAWGVLYVVEGSRLGGAMLAGQVAPGLPCRYLQATFQPGEWRALRMAIDAAAATAGASWLGEAIVGAEACFDLYRSAVHAAR